MPDGFFAYPSNPAAVGEAVEAARHILSKTRTNLYVDSWIENDIAGRFIIDPILDQIETKDFLAADITKLNFNVTYEIGYAIGREKRILLVKNGSIRDDSELIKQVGIFDTLGYKNYTNSAQLAGYLGSIQDTGAIRKVGAPIDPKSPVYLVLPRNRTDFEIHLLARTKKAGLFFRTFDPEESGRLSALEAITNVSASHGIIVPLLSSERNEALVHNLRAAFVAGLAAGMEKKLLLLQQGDEPVPLDYRDFVTRVQSVTQIETHIGEFASKIMYLLQSGRKPIVEETKTFLAKLTLGASTAENEMNALPDYYLETDEYRRTAKGEAQIVAGRKGSGKTALFVRLRNKLRQHRQYIILDLKPEGYQLLKFKDVVLSYLEQGTKEHTITAFWEYLLLLEACHKIIVVDKDNHVRNHKLFEPYRAIQREYQEDTFVQEADFAERILKLTHRIAEDFKEVIRDGQRKQRLSSEELTKILYKHDTKRLRTLVSDYLKHKGGLWILFDNLDKGWPSHGLEADDLIILRCLLDAIRKLERFLSTYDDHTIVCHGVVFLRNDVYELLLLHTVDRGKLVRIMIDWTDPDLLRQLLKMRIMSNGVKGNPPFEDIWRDICATHVGAQESSAYLIDRSLMRPRNLLDFLNFCRSHAVNLGHEKIQIEDIERGEESYSTELVTNIGFEIRDIYPKAGDLLYELAGMKPHISSGTLDSLLEKMGIDGGERQKLIELLLWYGVLGLVRADVGITYIYNAKYDMKLLKALIKKVPDGNPVYYINPAFWSGLEIDGHS